MQLNRLQQKVFSEFERDNPALKMLIPDMERALRLLRAAYDGGGKVMVCGNGGSAADSEHIVGELMKGFRMKRPLTEEERGALNAVPGLPAGFADKLQRALPAIALNTHSALNTAFANDVDAQMIFAQQVFGYGRRGDVLIALSTSGGAHNVINAVHAARARGMSTIAITGQRESALSARCDVCLKTPSCETYRVQEFTLPVYHTLCALIEAEYFEE